MNQIHVTRESWLQAGVGLLKEQLFDPREYHLPPVIRVSCGLCPGKAIGICMDPDCVEDGSIAIFLDPRLNDSIELLATLLHELCHASVGIECKHKGAFVKIIRDLGLEGKPTATVVLPETELHATLTGIALVLGEYPHAPVVRKPKPTKKHAWVSFISTTNEDFIVRANINTVKELGPPRDHNGEPMVPKNPEDMEDADESLGIELKVINKQGFGYEIGPDAEDGSDAEGFKAGDARMG